ncbi:hypothetical protein J2Y45_006706 [Dyadobacter sp. BE34]|uniref:Lipid A 3-O-deacylase-related protein n=1 Tax=Dyadobacter fermentans TaxID=94254 RepID=A0ABU1R8A7_9BACT|nr:MULTISPECIES: acyloxyacyl hydrolase [Dyadobacter]MDR6809628.1 hypothetical protein [Dyadobacter fermentans]MDR7047306.1 hypothetical protein [Dyadobacter sp. BE242]MDR7201542.1 hypothetical protein [Dyadobacter sp. BE34]MDR7219412.1 hypothetical protein [Dyadobacter sp. BE31]MDR7267194.1 hypothetical protein [Dyadobacter sp. BE32]
MRKVSAIVFFILTITAGADKACAQYPPGDRWYQNPLGFEPLSLHTSMGLIVPALLTGAALILTRKDSALHERLTLYTEVSATSGYKYPYTNMTQGSTGLNLMLRKWLSVGVELSTTVPFDDYNSTVGFAIRPFARFCAVDKPAWKLWFESGGGLVYFTDHFPKPTSRDSRAGTYLNGTSKYGIGASVRLRSNIQLLFGARHLHISNGNTKGADRNPSHDSNGLFAGLSWIL